MNVERLTTRRVSTLIVGACVLAMTVALLGAQQPDTDTRDPNQAQDAAFAQLYKEWTGDARYGSPLVDHLPIVKGIPTPKDVLGYHIGAPRKLTYYADILKYYRALAAATPRVQVETIGRSDEGRELVVVWVSSEPNMKALQANRDRLAKIADPRGRSEAEIRQLIATTKPNYHVIGGLHSSETGPPEMLMELVYRIATETSPFITQIRSNVYVSVTPVAEPDGRDRYRRLVLQGPRDGRRRLAAAQPEADAAGARAAAGRARRRRERRAEARPRRTSARVARSAAEARVRRAAGRFGGGAVSGASTWATTTTATSTSRWCRSARSPSGSSRPTRRSCTTCTSRCR